MQKTLSVLLVASLFLSACSNWRTSRANPSNWFGSSTPAEAPPPAADDPNLLVPQSTGGKAFFSRPEQVDTSAPITSISELRIDPTNTGAIVIATGVADRQGAFDAALVPDQSAGDADNGVLAYTFKVTYPREATAQGPERSRTITQAVNLSRQQLQGVRLIRVSGQQNAREARRR